VQKINLFLTPFLGFIISFLLFPVLIKLLNKWQVYDSAKEHKIHESFTPSLGGIAIYIGILIALAIGLPFQQWIILKYFFIALSLMFIIGLRDDVLSLSPIKKLASQLLPIFTLVVFGQVTIEPSLFLIDFVELHVWVGISITIITVILITNSYNLIDGIDGLAGTVGGICMLTFGIWFYMIDSLYLCAIAFCTVGALLAFLIFNWQPSKIFMGDTGALLIGMLLSFYSIQFLNANEALSQDHFVKFHSSFGTLICILIIPVFDTFRVVILRLQKGLSPLKADKNHIHHQLLSLGLRHSTSVVSLGLTNIIFIGIAIVLKDNSDYTIISLVILLSLAINILLKKFKKKLRHRIII